MKKIVSLLIIFSMLFSFCACSKINALFSSNQEQSFSYPISEMPKTIDPQIASSESELIIIENCMEGLVRFNSSGEIIPAIARSWDISGDGLKYTFHLNPAASWSVDTTDEDFPIKNFKKSITANDFVFAVSRAVLKETGAADFQSVSLIKNALKINSTGSKNTSSLGIKAMDEHTLVITLESPNSDFLSSLTNAVFMPCSEQFFDYCAGRYGRQAKYFLSNAGFELKNWNETSVVMKKYEDYPLSNKAAADSVTLYKDENAFESFKNDNYDALAISDDNIDEALSDTSLKVQTYDDTVWVLGFNCASKLCSSKSFRQALMLGTDTSSLSSPDWARSAKGIVPNICSAGGKDYNFETQSVIKFSPEKASQRFQSFSEAFLEKEDSDVLPSLKFLCTAPFEKTAKEIVQSWENIFGTGFEVKIEVLSLEELAEAVEINRFDAVLMPLSADTTDALVFLKKFSSENVFNYSSKEYNSTINSSLDEKNKCKSSEKILLKDSVIYPLFNSNSYYVQREKITGIYFYAFGGKVNFLNAQRTK